MKTKSKKRIGLIFGAVIVLLVLLAVCFYYGMLQLNNPSRTKYPIRGVDVSSYQGEIDWPLLTSQDIDFAFLKATEGSSYLDKNFAANWENALQTNLKVGAYHFFSFESTGEQQAQHFINTVPILDGTLPPVIDVEFYSDFAENPPDPATVTQELQAMLDALEAHYGVKPILYTTKESYFLYVKGYFDDYPQWNRSVYKGLDYVDDDQWTFWQYSNRKKLSGYNGDERYIDMNCFNGDMQAFELFCNTSTTP